MMRVLFFFGALVLLAGCARICMPTQCANHPACAEVYSPQDELSPILEL